MSFVRLGFKYSKLNLFKPKPIHLYTSLNKRYLTTTSSKWLKRIGITFSTSIGGLIGWLYYNHHEEENWRRSLYFWGNLYPIYVHYRCVDIYTKNWDEHKRHKAFQKLHEKYKYKIYNIVIHLQGFYLKLGQLGASRTE
eukprot:383885_1